MRTAARQLTFSLMFLLAGVILPAVLVPAPAAAAPDRREMQAREAFAAGRYREALDLFVTLYAERLHPNYLRNIGRCYQDLGEPDRAISSFREYLRKAKDLSAAERHEIDGYIVEMEALKRQQQEPAQPAPAAAVTAQAPGTPPSTPSPSPSPSPSLPASVPPAAPAAPLLLVVTPPSSPPPPREAEPPVYQRWWFWAIVGGVVVAGLGGAAAAGVFTTKTDAKCAAGRLCQ